MENICYCDITRHIIISRDCHALKLHYLQSYISIEMEILEYIWKKPIKNLFIKAISNGPFQLLCLVHPKLRKVSRRAKYL